MPLSSTRAPVRWRTNVSSVVGVVSALLLVAKAVAFIALQLAQALRHGLAQVVDVVKAPCGRRRAARGGALPARAKAPDDEDGNEMK